MADLQQLRSHEALNTTAAGKFSVADASSGGLGGLSGALKADMQSALADFRKQWGEE